MLRKTILLLITILFSTLMAMSANRKFTLVIDAGHGGHDSGAKGAISYEKNLTLRYALAFGKAVERGCPDVKVIYTRTTDVFLPLHERADIANRNKADLFISIHINALDHGQISYGFQSYTLGSGQHTGSKGLKENLEVARRENSVIFMEKNYQKTYQGLQNSAESDIMFELIADKNRERSVELSRLMQREVCKATRRANGGPHQNNLAVLRLTSMPAVLLELGFITTPDEEAFLNTDSALDLYTKGIYNAFVIYKNKYNDNIDIPYRDSNYSYQSTQDVPTVSSSSSKQQKQNTGRRQKQNSNNKSATDEKKKTADKVAAKPKVNKSQPVFKVQIFSSKVKVKDGSSQFKGLKGCESYEEGSYTKYTYGASNNYNEINRLRKNILDKFPSAFVIAFKDGKKMDVNDGIKEFLENKRKK